jgi:hypothetical protein
MIDLKKKSECLQDYKNEVVKLAVSTDKKSKFSYRIENISKNTISKYKGECLISQKGKACDFVLVFSKQKNSSVYLVEFKGAAIGDAVDQINSTIDHLKINNQSGLASVNGRILTSGTYGPITQSSKYKRLVKRCASLGGNLITKTGNFSEKL